MTNNRNGAPFDGGESPNGNRNGGNNSRGIIAWFAQNSVAANLLMVSLIVLGLVSMNDIRKEAFPSMEPRFVTISMTYDSGDPKQAEEGIAIKIETALEAIPGIKRITSTSNASGASVQVEKETEYDLDTLFNDIKTEVDSISNFPSDAENPVISKARRQEHAIGCSFMVTSTTLRFNTWVSN